jgi:DNA-binding NarL/FixJ family response regulator
MTVVLLTGDLMIVSRVEGAAKQCGAGCRVVTSAEQANAALDDDHVTLVVIDLAMPAIDIGPLVKSLKSRVPSAPTVVAFGPHVHEARLEEARRAGCDEVVSRGQFFAQLESILGRHEV